MNHNHDVDALVRAADPFPRTSGRFADQPLDDRARSELRTAISSHALRPRVGPRWARPVALAAVVVLVALLAAGVSSRFTAPPALASAATPPLLDFELGAGSDPAGALEQIEAAAAAAGDAPRSPGTTSWSEWALSTRIDGDQVTSAIIPLAVDQSHRPDGSGSSTVTTEAPSFPTKEYRQAWEATGEPGREGTVIKSERFGPGQFTSMFPDPPPTDDSALHNYLRVGHPIDDIGTAELFVAIADLRREWALSPAQRAAVVRQVAAAPDVIVLGATKDRLGRTGTAFAVDSDQPGLPTRHILVLGSTGKVLSWEEVLTTRAGRLNVPIPSVISYTAWKTPE